MELVNVLDAWLALCAQMVHASEGGCILQGGGGVNDFPHRPHPSTHTYKRSLDRGRFHKLPSKVEAVPMTNCLVWRSSIHAAAARP